MAKVVGILGGMGPAATVDLFQQIVSLTPARRDQDHLPILIHNDPTIPDRTAAILHGGTDPLPQMIEGVHRLERMGAQLIAMPCNTAHYYWGALQAQCQVPILHMIRETAQAIVAHWPGLRRIGVLATSGTLQCHLYQDALAAVGLTALVPDREAVAAIMDAVYQIKAGILEGEPVHLLRSVGAGLVAAGAEVLILGCTEIPLVLHDGDLPVPLLSSTRVLAQAVIREARASQEAVPAM
ncbi:amino acid racemase [Litorilinea aerophila]|uniref:Amino acid racemase n=1 Tax=Litorilinea aerophila TaxID=1204385 RepID=A0A540VL63_9CHLR|nr:amino acid racemase [Litorilinea aerophila]MCC9075167.1 amino acid racemase [Litorilinea aerophila]OUC06702.1 hypothetical protein RY27_19385 [Litorilinea aerophila]